MSNLLFDTHCHLDLLENFDSVYNELDTHGIYTIAVTNLPILYEKLLIKLNSKYVKPALGMHPELIGKYIKYKNKMWELLPNAKYIGEVGLDYTMARGTKEIQVDFFNELIERCNHLGGKVLTIHSRGSHSNVVEIIGNDFNGKFILHWYSGSKSSLVKAIDNGAYFSINYAMLNSENGKKVIDLIPSDRLLLETDAPFIKINNSNYKPSDLSIIVKKLAEHRAFEITEMKEILFNNFRHIVS